MPRTMEPMPVARLAVRFVDMMSSIANAAWAVVDGCGSDAADVTFAVISVARNSVAVIIFLFI